MATSPTLPPLLAGSEFANRLARLFPNRWASDSAKTPGGVLYSLLASFANEMAFELGIPASQTATLSGSATAGDVVTITVANPNLAAPLSFAYRVAAGDNIGDVASALAGLVSSNASLIALGIRARAVGPQITAVWPLIAPSSDWTIGAPASNATAITATVSNGATEGIAIAAPTAQGGSLQYAALATRVQTAIGNALDLSAEDYFGSEIPRNPGETDVSYRARILEEFFPPAITRPAIQGALAKLTGQTPRMVEPWQPSDVGVWDGPGFFWDIDTAEAPFRWTDPSLRYQGFIDTVLPSQQAPGGNLLLNAWDVGMFFDTGYGAYLDLPSQSPGTVTAVDALLNRIKAEGTTIWRRLATPAYQPTFMGEPYPQPAYDLGGVGAAVALTVDLGAVEYAATFDADMGSP